MESSEKKNSNSRKITFLTGNARGGVSGRTPIRQEITSMAAHYGANLIGITEVGLPANIQVELGGFKPAGVAVTKKGRTSHAGAGIWRSKKLPINIIDIQRSEDIPGFQAVELVFPTFGIILFYRSPDNIKKQTAENIIKVRDYFRTKTG